VDIVHAVVCLIRGREDLSPVAGSAIDLSITVLVKWFWEYNLTAI
jgi:hypothetical protein